MANSIELRYFGGLKNKEIAGVPGIHERTAKRDWQFAQAWVITQLRKGKPDAIRGMGGD